MTEETKVEVIIDNAPEDELKDPANELMAIADDPKLIRFAKPYVFEGKTYTEIDISSCGYDSLTTADITACKAIIRRRGWIAQAAMDNVTVFADDEMVKLIVSRKCGIPLEFFNNLPYVEFFKIQAAFLSLIGSAG